MHIFPMGKQSIEDTTRNVCARSIHTVPRMQQLPLMGLIWDGPAHQNEIGI